MSTVRRLLYPVIALGAAVLLAGGLTVVASAETTDDIVVVPFSADSGEDDDDCPIGFTEGTLGWHPGSRIIDIREDPETQVVEPTPECPIVPTFTTNFSAYARGVTVASTSRGSGGGFSFTAAPPVDLIVVQVCRRPHALLPMGHCGEIRQYPTPFSGNS